ncbi:Ubiquitin-like protein 3 [Geranomyces michiganensis]|nr:Ubiquitin-like protein 3 [Geranomyces michiganensis]
MADSTTHTVTEPSSVNVPVVVNDKIPADKVNVRFLLVSGKRSDLLCDPSDTVDEVRAKIYAAWPTEWHDEHPEAVSQLRVLHQGKFFEPSHTLASYRLEPGQTTTVHLLLRAGPAAESESPGAKGDGTRACRCCVIM